MLFLRNAGDARQGAGQPFRVPLADRAPVAPLGAGGVVGRRRRPGAAVRRRREGAYQDSDHHDGCHAPGHETIPVRRWRHRRLGVGRWRGWCLHGARVRSRAAPCQREAGSGKLLPLKSGWKRHDVWDAANPCSRRRTMRPGRLAGGATLSCRTYRPGEVTPGTVRSHASGVTSMELPARLRNASSPRGDLHHRCVSKTGSHGCDEDRPGVVASGVAGQRGRQGAFPGSRVSPRPGCVPAVSESTERH